MYQSKLSKFAPSGVSQAIVDEDITLQANSGRVPAQAVKIVNSLGFELPAKPAALILALNAAENARPFNTKNGHALLLELFGMAQAIANNNKTKNLPTLVLPDWATEEARAQEAAKKAEKKAAKKAEKAAEKAPTVKIATLEMLKTQIAMLSNDEKENLLGFLAESLGYQETTP